MQTTASSLATRSVEDAARQAVPSQPTGHLIPCLWPGSTIICVGSGPSLHHDDLLLLEHVDTRGHRIVAVNDAYRQVVADVLYAADARWWQWHAAVPDHDLPPRLYTCSPEAVAYRPSVTVIQRTGATGLEGLPHGVRSGGHGGYQALNLAAHLTGPGGRILLVGYDLLPSPDGTAHHAEGLDHPDGSHVRYAQWEAVYDTMLPALSLAGISVYNCSRRTAITAFPRVPLADALAG